MHQHLHSGVVAQTHQLPATQPTFVTSIRQIDATEVFPNLWQGGLHQFTAKAAPYDSVRPTTVGFTDLDRVVVLAPDARVIVTLPPAKLLDLDDSGNAASDMAKIAEASAVADRLASHLAAGRRVGVFCNAGRNRSGLVSALTIRRLAGWTGEQAMRRIQALRYLALTNQHFARYLRGLGVPQRRAVSAT